jgi:hypothetical protein
MKEVLYQGIKFHSQFLPKSKQSNFIPILSEVMIKKIFFHKKLEKNRQFGLRLHTAILAEKMTGF